MPFKSSPAASQSSKKQQQSISSFFTAKPSPAATQPPPPKAPSSFAKPPSISQPALAPSPIPSSLEFPDDDSLFLQSEDDQSPQPPKRPRSNHAKRVLEDDENIAPTAEDAQPPAKKLRVNSSSYQDVSGGAIIDDPLAKAKPPPLKTQTSQKISDRTSKYLFKSGPFDLVTQEDDEEDVDEETLAYRKRLHERFVKKLGRPDSIAEIKRRNHVLDDDATPDPDEEMDEEEEPEPEPKGKGRKGVAATKKGAAKLTPMEKQFLEIKRKHMDTLLVYEVGYKFRFMGEDARVAAKELGIVCIPGKFRYDEHPSEAHLSRFAGASIPVHRLHVHVKRLVAAGHKVGVVRQIETAALKAVGDNRNAPFIRKLTNLYTKGTYVDDVDGLDVPVDGISGGAGAAGYLLCLTETNAKGWGTDEKVQVGIVAVQPATGDIIYDDFEDGFMRTEIETRLLHISPCEFLIVGDLSAATEKLVQHLSGSRTNVFGDQVRVERIDKPKTIVATSYNHVSNFYAEKLKDKEEGADKTVLDKVHKLSDLVTVCLSSMINHLQEYSLEHVFDLTKNFSSFSARSHMLLNGNTLNSLEIYKNQTDNTEKGSLFSIMDQTQTRFGQRLLRKWCGRPLLDKTKLEERVDAVEELKEGERTIEVDKLKHVLSKLRVDLEKTLIRVYYKKCTRPELLGFLQSLAKVAIEYAYIKNADSAFKSQLLSDAVSQLPHMLDYLNTTLEKINAQAAKEDDKYAFFREEYETEPITEHKVGIACVEHDLDAYRKEAATKLKKTKVEYITVSGIDYLIEIDNTYCKNVPASWVKISGTKKVSRFHTPEVIRWIRERDQHKEALAAACDDAFHALLEDISIQYQSLRDTIQALATLDCLLSLSAVAQRPDYCKPTFVTSTPNTATLDIVGGRHPMVEQILLDPYVPNDISLSPTATRALLITGPNMGGKSSYVRSIALIAIMAQVGSYVPATSATLSLLDAVYTRMGAFDNMMRGESTFMVELGETSDILKQATPRSLVVLDELGRGTSTHDGVAIAQAVLRHCVMEMKCLTLFITHYQNLAGMAAGFEGGELRNVHVRFEEGGGERSEQSEHRELNGGAPVDDNDKATGDSNREQEDEEITFLYQIAPGVAHRSYGLNVARLAGLPREVIQLAKEKSAELEEVVNMARLRSLAERVAGLLAGGEDGAGSEGRVEEAEEAGEGVLDVLLEGMKQL